MTPDGVLTPLHSFNYLTDGDWPFAPLIQTPDGSIYGITQWGGPPRGWGGTIFQMSTNGVFTNLFFFPDAIDAPNSPLGYDPISLFLSSDGNFYGTTDGGTLPGSVFKMTPDGAITVLWTFSGHEPHRVFCLLETGDGYLYGTTAVGGTNCGCTNGTIIRIGRSPGSPTQFANFGDAGGTNGTGPEFLMLAADGNFYGRATYGGAYGMGTIFKMTRDGTLSAIHSFSGPDEGRPTGLMQATDGNLYGTTYGFGSGNLGVIFRLAPGGQFTVLHSFSAADACGNHPFGLVQGKDGSFYGTTEQGGTNGGGAVFKMTVASADAPWIQTVTPSIDGTTLKWLALKGRDYQVQSCSDLSGNWTNVGLPVTAISQIATASEQTSSAGQRFYRVALLP